jgi:uncharacterized protein YcaQ
MAVRLVGEKVSNKRARRIALIAQGFGEERPGGNVGVRQLKQVVDRVGVLQVDSVNVLTRSHYLPLFARVGGYERETLDRMCWGEKRELFEYFWGHKASLIPLGSYRLLRWRMRAAERQDWSDPDVTAPWAVVAGMQRLNAERPGYVDQVLAVVGERGPVTAAEANPDGVRRKSTDPHPDPTTGAMWNWQDAKIAIEYLFCTGQVTIASRRNFERYYDLTERVIPEPVLRAPGPAPDDARRELVKLAANALGVATAKELCGARGYFPLPSATARHIIKDLVDAGDLIPVQVEGVDQPSYLSKHAEDHPVDARALLSPFDTLIWNRDRTERLFDFFYRISIYTPAAQRMHGYYVLPFLLGDRLVARVDLKADRQNSALLVPTITAEPGTKNLTEPLAAELTQMAEWLHLDQVLVLAKGPLGKALKQALA